MEKTHKENKKLAAEKVDLSQAIDNEFKEIKESSTDSHSSSSESKQNTYLFITILIILLIIACIFFIPKFYTPENKTIDDLLDDASTKKATSTSFVYNGFSFIKQDGTWYTHIQSSLDNQIYTIPLHFSPKEVENLSFTGDLEYYLSLLGENNISDFQYQTYLTFDPVGNDLAYIALATGELSINLGRLFNIAVVAGCTNDKDPACLKNNTVIITCENTTSPVIFFKEELPAQVNITKNCITIQGREYDFVKGVDRLLYRMYGIMK
ncbi:hypothetical protein J4232_03265 [Candidatus Woesearchaeota archaeon]|nr:hypothetical protein [Candidatus Woesearchaeota archaeon]